VTVAPRPPVVVSPGLGVLAADFDAVRARLPGWDWLVVDRTDPARAPGPWRTLAEEAARLHDACRRRGLVPPYLLVGHSTGGLVVQAAARLHPDRVSGLLLVDSSCPPARAPAGPGQRRRHRQLSLLPVVGGEVLTGGLTARVGPLARRLLVWAGTVRGSDPLPAVERRRVYGDPRTPRLLAAEWLGYRPALAELSLLARQRPLPPVPGAVLAAARTGRPARRFDPGWVARQRALAAGLGLPVTVVADAAHLLMLDRPDLVAEQIEGLTVQGLAGGRG